jgi:hypothetical protein
VVQKHDTVKGKIMDTGQKTESIAQLIEDIVKDRVALPEFQRDFVWDIEKTFDLFDSFVRDIFVGSLIYGVPTFEITVRELDKRPRSGKGSRARLKLSSYTRDQIENRVKVNGFRLLLDGQQRATSIYRAMMGVDPVFFIALNEDELAPEVRAKPPGQRSIEQVLSQFLGEPVENRVSIRLHDVYRVLNGEASREREKAALFLESNKIEGVTAESVESSTEFLTYLTQLKNLENLCRQEKLVAYYLLDTDEEKFALFFERSNSKGIQLNFIDILAAKLYAGFNLRSKIEDFEEDNPTLELNREVLVRAISFHVSQGKEIGRSYILSNLTHAHFNSHWETFISAYKKVHDFLRTSRLLIHPTWMPYENMMLPLIAFAAKLLHHDFSQVSSDQAKLIRTWYWLAIFSRRYSSAAQTYALEDAQALQRSATGDFAGILGIIQRIQPIVRDKDDLLIIHKKYDAVYKGVLNLVNYQTGGYLNFENGNPVSVASNLEDHHIFPNDYLKKNWVEVHESLDSEVAIDCVVNRTLIPKLTNVKVSNKPPSKYLSEIKGKNSNISNALHSHMLSDDILTGDYDKNYDFFLDERAEAILGAIRVNITEARADILGRLSTS